MKKYILTLFVLAISTVLFAQTPQGINYQVVARDNAGQPIVNTSLTFTIAVKQSSTTLLTEYHTITSNSFGLCQMVIGSVNTNFNTIDWSVITSIKIGATDGTTTYDLGEASFQSVPYALYSHTAENLKGFQLDVSSVTPTNGQVLKFNNGVWEPANDDAGSGATPTLASGQILVGDGASNSAQTVSGDVKMVNGVFTIENDAVQLDNIDASQGTNGQHLIHNGTKWVAQIPTVPVFPKLHEVLDVDTLGIANDYILKWNATDSKWVVTAQGGGTSPWVDIAGSSPSKINYDGGISINSNTSHKGDLQIGDDFVINDGVTIGTKKASVITRNIAYDGTNLVYQRDANAEYVLLMDGELELGVLPSNLVNTSIGAGIEPLSKIVLKDTEITTRSSIMKFENPSNQEVMVVDGAGARVAIGTDADAVTLTYKDSNQGAGKVLTSDANGNATWQMPTGGSSPWAVSGTDINRLTGNIGIGTTIPKARIHIGDGSFSPFHTKSIFISDDGVPAYLELKSTDESEGIVFHAFSNVNSRSFIINNQSAGTANELTSFLPNDIFAMGTQGDKPYQLMTNSTPRIFIEGNGNVGIGTADPKVKLQVNGVQAFTPSSTVTASVNINPNLSSYVNITNNIPIGKLDVGVTAGQILYISNSAASTVVMSHGGNLHLRTGTDYSMGTYDTLTLIWNGSVWLEIGRSNNN